MQGEVVVYERDRHHGRRDGVEDGGKIDEKTQKI